MTALLVAIGGGVGAVLRWALARWVLTARFPWATLVANVVGSLLLGVVVASVDGSARVLLGTGLAGALTTYSAFALESVLLQDSGRRSAALLNLTATLTLGTAAFALGLFLPTR